MLGRGLRLAPCSGHCQGSVQGDITRSRFQFLLRLLQENLASSYSGSAPNVLAALGDALAFNDDQGCTNKAPAGWEGSGPKER